MPRLIRALISASLIGGLMWQFGPEVVAELSGLNMAWLGLAMVISVFQVIASAWRWRFTAARLGVPLGFSSAISEYYLATLVNQVLPGGVMGDAQRAWRHSRALAHKSPAIQAVVIERLSGQCVMLALAGVAAWHWAITPSLPNAHSVGVFTVVVIGVIALIIGGCRRYPPRWLSAWRTALWQALLAPAALPRQLLASVLIAGSYLAIYACCLAAMGAQGSLWEWISLVPLVLAAMLIPLSIAGWGLREGAAAALWPLAGLPVAQGLSAAVVYGAVIFVASLPGLLALRR